MSFVQIQTKDSLATVTITRGKVNALNKEVVAELSSGFVELREDDSVRAIVLTGSGRFFSFGFDLPELLSYSRPDLKQFLMNFNRLLTELFLFPKPIIGALNGHTTAGGCMLATALDFRVMVAEKARISLNEINIGVPVFSGPAAMLQYAVGKRNAETILYGGQMLSGDEALRLGLVDILVQAEQVADAAAAKAGELASKNPAAFASLKKMLRQAVVDDYVGKEEKSVEDWLDIWFTDEAQSLLRKVEIRS